MWGFTVGKQQHTLNRLASLLQKHHLGIHDIIDLIDHAAKYDTKWEEYIPYSYGTATRKRTVGARLALHEDKLNSRLGISAPDEPPKRQHYHWLGADACCQCGCGEHRR